ncbi:prepilin-type N-terminal cleavage/methylation domain-containing protein [Bhargavaea massiliensis]|uniref:prepilin-type N-terminal cleavage/methylation domain-containing protein n=1 Tax=Bhargavaea massiliensis TaxID=2697500 RepID=UPI001BCBCD8A|nr:prepilin-type N-terminal cleavage/methylation domain-containing protein [Bhargavaea massiliensis]
MNKWAMKRNENGLTLVEILATLVIIGIVFIGIMAIFPQMTLFNERTEVKLDAMSIARAEIELLKQVQVNRFGPEIGAELQNIHLDRVAVSSTAGSSGQVILSYQLPNGYQVEASIFPAETDEQLDSLYLHQVHLVVMEGGTSRRMSETYAYLEIEPPSDAEEGTK